MPCRSPAEKLRSTLPKVRRGLAARSSTPRRPSGRSSTRPPGCSPTQGYAATSLDAIVAGARVTKGALYHHFSGKQAVFEAVFEKIESDASATDPQGAQGSRDPWEKALIGLRAFLEIVQDPAYQRVVIQEGPAVLGYERFREQEERSSYGLVQDMVRDVLRTRPTTSARRCWRRSAGSSSARCPPPARASAPRPTRRLAVAQVETAIAFILAGLRTLAENGVELPDPGDLVSPADED